MRLPRRTPSLNGQVNGKDTPGCERPPHKSRSEAHCIPQVAEDWPTTHRAEGGQLRQMPRLGRWYALEKNTRLGNFCFALPHVSFRFRSSLKIVLMGFVELARKSGKNSR